MKNLHKLVLGLLVSAMAIGFSAFTNARPHKKGVSQTNYYFCTSGIVGDTNPAHYVYDENGTCTLSSKQCQALWTTNSAPVQGDSPTASGSPVYAGDAQSGTYKP